MTSKTVRRLVPAALALMLAFGIPISAAAAVDAGQVKAYKVLSGFDAPIGVVNAGDGTRRLFVVQQGGLVRVVQGSSIRTDPFLDVRSKVLLGGERGLLSIAFDPGFATNHRVYAYYTRKPDGAIIVSRFTANASNTTVDASTERPILQIAHATYTNHNGGAMVFGPDGYLYLGVGDGGSSGDPDHHAQDTGVLLGKILRIDVKGTGSGPFDRYAIPPSNPFVGKAGLDEIWAYGLRNPWRVTFDRRFGAMWVGDVGQSRREEIDRQPAGTAGGRNYGWPITEGNTCYAATTCDRTGLIGPIATYTHSLGCAVTGGYVYRGARYPDLVGLYVFADYCSGRLWTVAAGGSSMTQHLVSDANISSFGEAESGELYFTGIGGTLHLIAAP